MTIEYDNPENYLPPLKPRDPPLIPIVEVLAVSNVTLYSSHVPTQKFRDFYEKLLGLAFVEATTDHLHFHYFQHHVLIEQRHAPADEISAETPVQGKLILTVRRYDSALEQLRQHHIPCELLHTESGLARMALFQDPGGNWIHLIEIRPL